MSLEFQSLGGTDRIAYDNAFKEYLRLQPGAESKDIITTESSSDKFSGSPQNCDEEAYDETFLNGSKVVSPLHSVVPMDGRRTSKPQFPPEDLDLKNAPQYVNDQEETSPLLILHSNNTNGV